MLAPGAQAAEASGVRYADPDGLNPYLIFLGVGLAANEIANSDVPMIGGGLAKAGAKAAGIACQGTKSAGVVETGGLNLFKWGKGATAKSDGWKEGDFMLYLTDKGGTKINWAQNAGRIREQMRKGNPIYDSYRDPVTGLQIPTQGFLRAERNLLEGGVPGSGVRAEVPGFARQAPHAGPTGRARSGGHRITPVRFGLRHFNQT